MDNNNVNLQGIADDVYKLFPFSFYQGNSLTYF